jgi:hypothetical protein
MNLQRVIIIALACYVADEAMARECHLPKDWQKLCSNLQFRVDQTSHKMKLKESEAKSLEHYLQTNKFNFHNLSKLQSQMPKTTTELLMATDKRGLNKNEAEKMAKYLMTEINRYKFKNLSDFDNNTSHIIGREWHEIDYSGESMTWEKQKEKYARYGITNFKSLACLQKFFPVESKLPYFNKIYQPMNVREK